MEPDWWLRNMPWKIMLPNWGWHHVFEALGSIKIQHWRVGERSGDMSLVALQDPPLNIYMVIFGIGLFVSVFSLIFCCYFISKLRRQAQRERFGYKTVVFKGDPKKLNLHGQTCAVCLEDFRAKNELGVLPCQHGFHRGCLLKWLEIRCVCPMCNKPIAGHREQRHSVGTLLDELV